MTEADTSKMVQVRQSSGGLQLPEGCERKRGIRHLPWSSATLSENVPIKVNNAALPKVAACVRAKPVKVFQSLSFSPGVNRVLELCMPQLEQDKPIHEDRSTLLHTHTLTHSRPHSNTHLYT